MEREIKFRVWCSNDVNPNGRMYYPSDVVEVGVGNRNKEGAFVISQHGDLLLPDADVLHMDHGFTWARVSNNGLALMQYTGLKDTNGKEIYEGDIIRVLGVGRKEVINTVEFRDGCFMRVHSDYPNDPSYLYDAFGWEIIGNIYETPELATH